MAEELKIAEEKYGKKIPSGIAYKKNYLDMMRKSEVNF
jgi:hypothetical protein